MASRGNMPLDYSSLLPCRKDVIGSYPFVLVWEHSKDWSAGKALCGVCKRPPICLQLLQASELLGCIANVALTTFIVLVWGSRMLCCNADVAFEMSMNDNLLTGTIPAELQYLPLRVSTAQHTQHKSALMALLSSACAYWRL